MHSIHSHFRPVPPSQTRPRPSGARGTRGVRANLRHTPASHNRESYTRSNESVDTVDTCRFTPPPPLSIHPSRHTRARRAPPLSTSSEMTLATLAFLLLASAPLARAVDVDNQACATSGTQSADFFPSTLRVSPNASVTGSADAFVEVGRLFDVYYSRSFKVVRVKTDAGLTAASYVLYQCGTPTPTTYDNGTALPTNAKFFSVPVQGVATELTTVIGVLEQLGLRDKLKLVNPSSVHAPCVQALEENNTIAASHTFGWPTNYTHWHQAINNLGSSIDMVVTDGWGTGSSNSVNKNVAFDNTAAGLSMLERTEKMKFLAMFFNKEAEASAYYADQVERWTYMSSMIAAAQGRGGVPTGYKCAWVDGGYNKIYFTKYKRDICEAAGLTMWVPTAAPAGATSYSYPDRATFLADMVNVNVVIDETYAASPSTYDKTAAFAALGFDTVSNLPSDDPRTGLVLRVDKHTSDGDTAYAHADGYTAYEGLTWFEDQMVHPALVLQDLIRLSWLNTFITPVQTGCPRFFRDMSNNDTVIKTTAADCPTWDRARAEKLCLAQLTLQRTTVASLLGASSANIGARLVVSCVLAVIISMTAMA